MKRNIKTATVLTCGLLAAMLTGCTQEQTEPYEGTSLLQVVGMELQQPPAEHAAQGNTQSRAAEINGTFTFENGDAMSLFMRGTTYTSVDNRKVTYNKPGTATGTWTIEGNSILLNDRTAVVSLVYPYNGTNAFNNIPFTTGVYTAAKDLLWKQQDVYASVSKARVENMKHALTRVQLTVKRDASYIGTGAVTSVSIANGTAGTGTSAAVFTAGKLNLSFVAPVSPVSGVTAGAVGDNTPFTLPPISQTTSHITDLLTLPIATLKKDLVTLGITIDGMSLTTSLPFAAPAVTEWEAGKCYKYTITVKSKGFDITSSIGTWTTVDRSDQVVSP